MNEQDSKSCECGCGVALPPEDPGRRGRKRLYASPSCSNLVREARIGGWTAASDMTPRQFVAVRLAGSRDGGAERPVAFVNPAACACGCRAPARWARGSCLPPGTRTKGAHALLDLLREAREIAASTSDRLPGLSADFVARIDALLAEKP